MIKSLLLVIFCFGFAFFNTRAIFDDIIEYLMNKNAIKKRKKGMSITEWFTFSRFRTEIPHCHIVIYYIIITIYIIFLLLIIILYIENSVILTQIELCILGFTIILVIIYHISVEGFHTKHTYIHHSDKIHLKGIDKKAYREKMRKLNEQAKKEAIKNEENSNNNTK